jgi:hypothetical protein
MYRSCELVVGKNGLRRNGEWLEAVQGRGADKAITKLRSYR